jgi:hypothetical protein
VPPGWQLWVPDDTAEGRAWPSAPALEPGVHYYTADQPASGTNGFAIASFVLGLIGGSLLSVIFGIVALNKISHRPQRGKGLAIAGLCLSGVWVIGIVAVLVVSSQSASQRSTTSGQITKSGNLDVLSLRTGDCFQNPAGNQPPTTLKQLTAVPCTTAHNAQVIAQLPVSGSAYPGADAFTAQAKSGCNAKLADLVQSKLTQSMNLIFLYPEPLAWTEGQRVISCVVVDSSPDITSSLLK